MYVLDFAGGGAVHLIGTRVIVVIVTIIVVIFGGVKSYKPGFQIFLCTFLSYVPCVASIFFNFKYSDTE